MKKFCIFAVLIFSSYLAFAEFEFIPKQDAKPQQYVQVELGRSFNRGLDHNQTYVCAEYNFNFEPFFGFAGVQTNANVFDIVFRTEYTPIVFYCDKGEWHFGATFAYHFQKCSDYYKENDFILESAVRYKTKNNFCFSARLGYSWRRTRFPVIEDFYITDRDLTLVNEIDKIWNNGIEIFFALSSYSNFRYPLFFCPQYTAGFAFNFDKTLRLSTQLDFGTTDFLASVVYINYAVLKFGVRFSF